MADATIESLEIKIQHNASGTDAEIEKVATAIEHLKTATTGAAQPLTGLANAMKAMSDALKGGTGKYEKFASAVESIAAAAMSIANSGSALTTLANAMDAISNVKITASAFNSLAKGIERLCEAAASLTAENLANLEKMVNILSKLQGVDLEGLGSAMRAARSPKIKVQEPVSAADQEMIRNADAVDVLTLKLKYLREAMEEAFAAGDAKKANDLRAQILQTEKALEKAKRAADGTRKGFREMAKECAKSDGPITRLLSSLKRIAMYRILRTILKEIGKAFSEGLEKAYIFSSGIQTEGHRFAEAMDRMKSSSNQMKGQLGAAFIALLAAIEPILITIINLAIRVADAISQFMSAFTGKTYLKANATAAQFADTMARGGAAAKEWKNQLLGFDEINRLNEPNQGGGGGGSNPLDGFDFVDSPINEKLLQFINNIKEKLQPAVDRLKEAFDRLKEAWGKFVDSLGSSAFSQFIEDVLVLASEAVINGLTILADVLTLLFNILSGDWSDAWLSFRQLLYDIIVAIADLIVGVTNLAMDALIMLAKGIDDIIGTHFADYLQADKDAFNAMYDASKQSEGGLFGLKSALGLTEKATEKVSDKTDGLTEALAGVSAKAPEAEQKVNGIRGAIDWVLQGFRDFGTEVGWIITGLFQPIADFCAWIDSAIQGWDIFKSMQRFNAPNYNVYEDPTMWTNNFATGGFPDEGQLFIAREAGPEMVGTIGGRTAVANNDQIVEGIRQGVYEAVSAAMSSNGTNEPTVKVYLDSREIRVGQQRLNRAMGV